MIVSDVTPVGSAGAQKQNAFPRGLLVSALIIVVLWGMWAGRNFLIPLLLAALLAFLMAPLVGLLRRVKVPDWLAILITSLLLVLPFLSIGIVLLSQAQSLTNDYPKIVAGVEQHLEKLSTSTLAQSLGLGEKLTMPSLKQNLSKSAGEGVQFLMHGLRVFFEAGTEATLILIFAILMLASRKHLRESGEKILSQFESLEAARLLEAVTKLIQKFLISKLVVVGLVSAVSIAALAAFGVPYSVLLGVLMGVMTLIPEVGFLISLVVILIVSIATGNSAALSALILGVMLVIHLIEANVLTPKLVGTKINLNALATFVGLFGGGLLWGVWGMFLCVPILGVMRIVFSVAPKLQPWADLLAERADSHLNFTLLTNRFRILNQIRPNA